MANTDAPTQVFISYAHVSPDADLAAKLTTFVESSGFRVFADTKIRVGQRWVDQIDTQLRRSAYCIVLVSEASAKSDMVRREVAIAYQLNKTGALTILPVRVAFEDTLPYEMAAYLDLIQYCSWKPGEPFDPVCVALLDAMLGRTRTIGRPNDAFVANAAPASNRTPNPDRTPVPSSARTPNPDRFPEMELERLKAELARHIGPLAGLIVQRAAREAPNWERLYESLAAEIPNPEERRRFQSSRRRS